MRKILILVMMLSLILISSNVFAYKVDETDPLISSKLILVGEDENSSQWYLNGSRVEFVNILSDKLLPTGIQFEAYVTAKDFKSAFTYIMGTDKENHPYLMPVYITSYNITPTGIEAVKTYNDKSFWIQVHKGTIFTKIIDTLDEGVSKGTIVIK